MAIETNAPMSETTRPMDEAERESDRRIREAKMNLSDRLHELERRIDEFKANLDPRSWLHNPWARFGAAFAVGYVLGRTRILRPLIAAGFTAAASAVVKEFVGRQMSAE